VPGVPIRPSTIGLVVAWGLLGASALGGVLSLPGAAIAAAGGTAAGVLVALRLAPRKRSTRDARHARLRPLARCLIAMGDALEEVSPRSLQRRGGWDRALFDDVLRRVQAQTGDYQQALVAYLAGPDTPPPGMIDALLAVDRLSAAYTYWTRLFPPGQQAESMFILSLLHDLSEKVEHGIGLLEQMG
jgi:hypothetical protein